MEHTSLEFGEEVHLGRSLMILGEIRRGYGENDWSAELSSRDIQYPHNAAEYEISEQISQLGLFPARYAYVIEPLTSYVWGGAA